MLDPGRHGSQAQQARHEDHRKGSSFTLLPVECSADEIPLQCSKCTAATHDEHVLVAQQCRSVAASRNRQQRRATKVPGTTAEA